MTGSVLNPGGRPRNAIEQLREKYMHRLPELLEGLFELTKSDSPHVRIAATRELLDRLIGKPQISIDAVTAKVDVGAMYLAALKRANGAIDGVIQLTAAATPPAIQLKFNKSMRLGEYLQLADIPQAKFAVLLGVQRATISRYISGTKIPPATDMLKIWDLSRGLVGLDDWMPPHSAGRTALTATRCDGSIAQGRGQWP